MSETCVGDKSYTVPISCCVNHKRGPVNVPVPGEASVTDEEFEALKRKIHKTMIDLIKLQKPYRQQTGRDYIINGPLPEAPKCPNQQN